MEGGCGRARREAPGSAATRPTKAPLNIFHKLRIVRESLQSLSDSHQEFIGGIGHIAM